MNARDIRQVDILESAKPYCAKYGVKLGKSALHHYVSGKVEPSQHKLTILGLALDVSEAWLMGYDVPIERNITPTAGIGDRRTAEYIELYKLLSVDQQEFILQSIKGLLSAR